MFDLIVKTQLNSQTFYTFATAIQKVFSVATCISFLQNNHVINFEV